MTRTCQTSSRELQLYSSKGTAARLAGSCCDRFEHVSPVNLLRSWHWHVAEPPVLAFARRASLCCAPAGTQPAGQAGGDAMYRSDALYLLCHSIAAFSSASPVLVLQGAGAAARASGIPLS